jgi:hemoglobin-like flavoprotein
MQGADLIERSLELAAERGEDLTPRVYARLFAEHPQMEALFWRDTGGLVKGEMLSRVIEAILDFIGPRCYAHHLIQCEVVTHAGYDVPPDVFAVFFGVVAATLREVVGPDWTPAIDAAWATLLAELDFYVRHPDQAETAAPA